MAGQPPFAVHILLTVGPKSVYLDMAERLLDPVGGIPAPPPSTRIPDARRASPPSGVCRLSASARTHRTNPCAPGARVGVSNVRPTGSGRRIKASHDRTPVSRVPPGLGARHRSACPHALADAPALETIPLYADATDNPVRGSPGESAAWIVTSPYLLHPDRSPGQYGTTGR